MTMPGGRSRAASAAERAPHWLRDDGWLTIAGPGLIFLACMLYGAMLPQTAVAFCLLWSALAALCLARQRLQAELLRFEGLGVPTLAFGAVLLVAAWSLTPYVPGGPHPVWAFLKISPGAATVDRSQTVLEIFKLLGLACAFLVGLATGGHDGRARRAADVILMFGAGYAAWAFLTFVATRASGVPRLEASFQSANTAGTVFAILFVLAFGPLGSRLRSETRGKLSGAILPATAALLFLVCLFMTASRGAFVGAVAGLVSFGLLQGLASKVRFSRALLIGLGGTVVILALMAVGGDYLLARLLGSNETVASRATIGEVHWEAFLNSPLMGYGLGTFDAVNRSLLNAADFQDVWSVRAAHNVYLGWLEQAGLLGALPMFLCIGALVAITLRQSSRRSRSTNLIFALIAIDVVIAVHGLTDFALEMFSVSAMWAYLLGLQFGLAQGASR